MAVDNPPQSDRLRVHLVADDLDPTHADGDIVASWPNRGTAGDAATASGDPRFVADSAVFDGADAVAFDGSKDWMVINSGLESPANTDEFTLIIWMRQTGTGNKNHPVFCFYFAGSERTNFVARQDNADSNLAGMFSSDVFPSGGGWLDSDTVLSTTEQSVVIITYEWTGIINDGRCKMFLTDRSDEIADVGVVQTNVQHTEYRICNGGLGGTRAAVEISELLVWDIKLTDSEIDDVLSEGVITTTEAKDNLDFSDQIVATVTQAPEPPGEGNVEDPGWEDPVPEYPLWFPITVERKPTFNRQESYTAALTEHQTIQGRNMDFCPTVDHFGNWAVTTDVRYLIAVSSQVSISANQEHQGKP